MISWIFYRYHFTPGLCIVHIYERNRFPHGYACLIDLESINYIIVLKIKTITKLAFVMMVLEYIDWEKAYCAWP